MNFRKAKSNRKGKSNRGIDLWRVVVSQVSKARPGATGFCIRLRCDQDGSFVGLLSFSAWNDNLLLAFTEKNAIQFSAQQCAEGRYVEPDQGGNAGAE